MRLVLVTLEYSSATFSGNGVLAQSQVRALDQFGHSVLVISATPNSQNGRGRLVGATELIEVSVSSWGCLDWKGPWKEFSAGVEAMGVHKKVRAFDPHAIVVVDWTSYGVYERLTHIYKKNEWVIPPLVFFSYRIFSRTNDREGKTIMQSVEKACFDQAICSFVLSKSDHIYAKKNLKETGTNALHPIALLPPLRNEMAAIPFELNSQELEGYHVRRPYFTCCVRLSEEKEPERFVDIVSEMVKRDLFTKYNLVPLLCSATSTPFAKKIRQRFNKAAPEGIIEERFLNCTQLAEMFSMTRLNVHPCAYDAYGMTIVEAASQGAPSVVDTTGHVGATTLLQAELGELVGVDFSHGLTQVVDIIDSFLADDDRLLGVGEAAASHVRNYTEETHVEIFLEHVQRALN